LVAKTLGLDIVAGGEFEPAMTVFPITASAFEVGAHEASCSTEEQQLPVGHRSGISVRMSSPML